MPRASILAAIETTGLVRFPPRSERDMGRNLDFYCRFHYARGHSTEHCQGLRDELERLAREGRLGRYVGDNRQANPRAERQPERNMQRAVPGRDAAPLRGARADQGGEQRRQTPPPDNRPIYPAIRTISGGEKGVEGSSRGRKAYAREALISNDIMQVAESDEQIVFTSQDKGETITPHDDPMVVTVVIANFPVERVLIDNGSSVNLLYWNCFEQMGISVDSLRPGDSALYSFTGEEVPIVGSIELPVTLGEIPKAVTRMVNFMVIRSNSVAYNVILGRPLLNAMKAVVHFTYLLMKFPTPAGIGQVRGDQKRARICYLSSIKDKGKKPMGS